MLFISFNTKATLLINLPVNLWDKQKVSKSTRINHFPLIFRIHWIFLEYHYGWGSDAQFKMPNGCGLNIHLAETEEKVRYVPLSQILADGWQEPLDQAIWICLEILFSVSLIDNRRMCVYFNLLLPSLRYLIYKSSRTLWLDYKVHLYKQTLYKLDQETWLCRTHMVDKEIK